MLKGVLEAFEIGPEEYLIGAYFLVNGGRSTRQPETVHAKKNRVCYRKGRVGGDRELGYV